MSVTQSPIDRLYAIVERDGLASLTEAEAGLLGIYWFVAETNNGGVHQFFFNDSGQFAMPALRYLEQIGAAKRRPSSAARSRCSPVGRCRQTRRSVARFSKRWTIRESLSAHSRTSSLNAAKT